jgi:hypothetical protein
MAPTKTSCLVGLLLAACLMASPALASRHLTQDPTVTPGTSPVPAADAGAGALPGAGGLVGNTTANETAIQQCYALLESYNITLVNATTNETLVSGWLLACKHPCDHASCNKQAMIDCLFVATTCGMCCTLHGLLIQMCVCNGMSRLFSTRLTAPNRGIQFNLWCCLLHLPSCQTNASSIADAARRSRREGGFGSSNCFGGDSGNPALGKAAAAIMSIPAVLQKEPAA